MMIAISKAKARLSELARCAADEDVVLMNHLTPAAVLVGTERYLALCDELETLRSRLGASERTSVTAEGSLLSRMRAALDAR